VKSMKSKKGCYQITEDYASDHFMIKDTTFHLIDLETGYRIASFVGSFNGTSESGVEHVSITRDNKTVVVANHDGSTHRYPIKDIQTRAEARTRRATGKADKS